MVKKALIFLSVLMPIILSGCLYPEEERIQNAGAIDTHIRAVQDAIDQFNQDTGVLPILNSSVDTPIYEKYVIDFNRIYKKYIGYLPGNAFENGGKHLYVLVDVETSPTVKLIDLSISSKVHKIQSEVNRYFTKYGRYPFAKTLSPYASTIDYKALKMGEIYVESPFTGQLLGLLITPMGEVIVDYGLDIGIYINRGYTYTGNDARAILVQNSFFVPAKSYPYIWENEEAKLSSLAKN